MAVSASPQTPPPLAERADRELHTFLASRRQAMAALDPDSGGVVDDVERLIDAGGKRLRPLLCYWGYRAGGGGDDDRIVRAGAALELLHTMALIHDDLIDAAAERRGVETVHVRIGRLTGSAARGRAGALLAGDLAAVFADQLFLESGFPSEVLTEALAHYHRMRTAMAAGQWLELVGPDPTDPATVLRRASLRGGAYTVEGPLAIGATLAGAPRGIVETLARFGEPLGRAFQLADDLADGEGAGVGATDIEALVRLSLAALEPLGSDARRALADIARKVAAR
jgi:geranylgeranyl diphosphate synthase, type I